MEIKYDEEVDVLYIGKGAEIVVKLKIEDFELVRNPLRKTFGTAKKLKKSTQQIKDKLRKELYN